MEIEQEVFQQMIFTILNVDMKNLKRNSHQKIEYYDKISSLESELKPDFFRIHKGYLVNIKYVERYDRTEVKMRNGDSLLISKYKYQDFVKRYLEYISEER